MSTTTLHHRKIALGGRHPFHLLPRQGESIKASTLYPSFHERDGNEGFSVQHSVLVDDGLVQVVSDPAQGHTAWIWFRESGEVIFTRSGWGAIGYALHDALNHAYGPSAA